MVTESEMGRSDELRFIVMDSEAHVQIQDLGMTIGRMPEFARALELDFWVPSNKASYYDKSAEFTAADGSKIEVNLSLPYGGRGRSRSPRTLEVKRTSENEGVVEVKLKDFVGKPLQNGMIPMVYYSSTKDGVTSTYNNSMRAAQKVSEFSNTLKSLRPR